MPEPADAVRTQRDDAPFRAELLGPDRLAEAAREIARGQQVTREEGPKTTPLLELTASAAEGLSHDHADLNEIAQRRRIIAPAGEWLLDNYYLIEHQIIEIREDLPPNYGIELPRLVGGSGFEGLPRSTNSPWASSHTPTRDSSAKRCARSCRRTSRSARSPLASAGPSRSCCASHSWRTFAASRPWWCTRIATRRPPTRGPSD